MLLLHIVYVLIPATFSMWDDVLPSDMQDISSQIVLNGESNEAGSFNSSNNVPESSIWQQLEQTTLFTSNENATMPSGINTDDMAVASASDAIGADIIEGLSSDKKILVPIEMETFTEDRQGNKNVKRSEQAQNIDPTQQTLFNMSNVILLADISDMVMKEGIVNNHNSLEDVNQITDSGYITKNCENNIGLNSMSSFEDALYAISRAENRNLEVTRQDAHLNTFGMYRHPIIGDGNCLFRAISYSLHGTQNYHTMLRELATMTLEQNIGEFQDYFFSDDQHEILQEIARLRQPNTFAGQECVLALAKALKINILITIGGDQSSPEVRSIEHSFEDNLPRIHISWTRMGGGHYEAVMEKPPTGDPSQTHNCHDNDISRVNWKYSNNAKLFQVELIENPDEKLSTNLHDYAKGKPQCTSKDKISKNKLECQHCRLSFKTGFSLKRHMQKQHENGKSSGKLNCMIPSCQYKFSKVSEIIEHAVTAHGANVVTDDLSFFSEQEFEEFKHKEEEMINTRFIKKRMANINRKKSKVFQLVCHRDGYNKIHLKKGSKFEGKRKNKKGQCKINGLCPSRMYVNINENGTVKVKYTKTHSHSLTFDQSKYLPVPKDIKDEIATMVSLGIPINKILDKIRKSFTSRDNRNNTENIKHFHFIDRKTVHNIKKQVVSSSVIKHSCDATSVYLRVLALKREKFDPVLYYKPQFANDICSCLEKNDFMLVLMTKQQLSIYKQFANRIICMDSTHNTNQYSFKLITLLVPDQFRRGYPVAFCISNKEDETAIKIFLNSVKSKAPNCPVNVIMTDDDNSGWNAAKSVFGNDLKHYLCVWHIHKNWRKKLQEYIKDREVQAEIYSFLCAMLNAKTVDEFNKYRQKFLSKYNPTQNPFTEYYMKYYDFRSQKWAICFRTTEYANVNTNMFVESFHNQLKTIYFEGKRNRRIDVLIETLLQIEDYIFMQHQKRLTYSLPANFDVETMNRHTASLNIPDSYVCQIEKNVYTVKSSDQDVFYTVEIKNYNCKEEHCYVICRELPCVSLCLHMYTCSCCDFTTGLHICKHVHKVHSVYNQLTRQTQEEETSDNLYFCTPSEENKDYTEKTKLRKISEIKTMLKEIEDQMEQPAVIQYRLDETLSALRHIISANNGCKLLDNVDLSSFKKTEHFSSNARNIIQPRFKSTLKKSGRKPKIALRAPTDSQKRNLLEINPSDNSGRQDNTPCNRNSPCPQVSMEPRKSQMPVNGNEMIHTEHTNTLPGPQVSTEPRFSETSGNDNDMILTEKELMNMQQNPTLYRIPPNLYNKPVKIKLSSGKTVTVVFTKPLQYTKTNHI